MGDNQSGGSDHRKQELREIAGRLKRLRERAGPTTADEGWRYLQAAGIDIDLETYRSYEHAKRAPGRTTAKDIIRGYSVTDATVGWLLVGENEPSWATDGTSSSPAKPRIIFVPIVTPQKARELPQRFEQIAKSEKTYAVTDEDLPTIGPRAFIVTLGDDSMVPQSPFERDRFFKGDRVLIDPDRPHLPGDFVLFELFGAPDAMLRQFRASDRRSESIGVFVPLNPAYPTEEVGPNNPGRIIGRMIRVMRDY